MIVVVPRFMWSVLRTLSACRSGTLPRMNQRTPSFRCHATGQWFAKWGGRNHYFGTERAAAYKKFLASLGEWAEWRELRSSQRLLPPTQAHLVIDLAEKFLAMKAADSDDLRRYYAKHLGRFLRTYKLVRADVVRVKHLTALKSTMQAAHYAPKTVNHDIVAVKAMFAWAADQEMIPPVALRGCKTLPLGPPPAKAMSLDAIEQMMAKARDNSMRAWLAVNYLCLMRPTEVIRVVHRQGDWVEDGVFRLDRGKIDLKARMARHVVFSDEALTRLDACRPQWSRLDSYSNAVRASCGPGGPHPLRHSGATHLLQQGVDRAEIDLLLGHAPPRVSLTYAPIVWQPLRATVSRLTLGPAHR